MIEIIAAGKLMDFIYLILIFVSLLYFSDRAKKGIFREIRDLPAIAAIDEMVGRGTEMGRPVHFSPGSSAAFVGSNAAPTLAGLQIGKYMAGVAAKMGCEMFATTGGRQGPQVATLLEDMIKQAYMAEGKPEFYKQGETVRFLSYNGRGFVGTMSGIYEREKVAASVVVGAEGGGIVNMIGAAHQSGALFTYGTIAFGGIFWGVIMADYTLIGEEIFAGAAKVSKDPQLMSSVSAQDVSKWIAVILMLIGISLKLAGIDFGLLSM